MRNVEVLRSLLLDESYHEKKKFHSKNTLNEDRMYTFEYYINIPGFNKRRYVTYSAEDEDEAYDQFFDGFDFDYGTISEHGEISDYEWLVHYKTPATDWDTIIMRANSGEDAIDRLQQLIRFRRAGTKEEWSTLL